MYVRYGTNYLQLPEVGITTMVHDIRCQIFQVAVTSRVWPIHSISTTIAVEFNFEDFSTINNFRAVFTWMEMIVLEVPLDSKDYGNILCRISF